MAATHDIKIKDNPHWFDPNKKTLVQGNKVVWTSESTTQYTINPDVDDDFTAKDLIKPGETHEITIDRPTGRAIKYGCQFHDMPATIALQ